MRVSRQLQMDFGIHQTVILRKPIAPSLDAQAPHHSAFKTPPTLSYRGTQEAQRLQRRRISSAPPESRLDPAASLLLRRLQGIIFVKG